MAGGWRGVLLRGASGVGKSDLLLRLCGTGWRLVADDRVRVWRSGAVAWGAAPPALRDLMELRGQGLAQAAALPFAPIVLVAEFGDIEDRQPEATFQSVAGVATPSCRLRALDASAPARLRCLVAEIGLARARA